MSEIPVCSITISSQLPAEDIESLKTSLSLSSINLQNSPSRVVAADDILFILTVIGGIDAASNLIPKLVRVLKDWRRKLREKGEEPQGTLKQKNLELPPLDISKATDEEIEKWFEEINKWLLKQD